MSSIFLSAGVPIVGRGNYHETADPFLIQFAVRELIVAVIRTHRIVWGGQPAITPMIYSICEDLKVSYAGSVVLYQSRFFEGQFPEETLFIPEVIYVDGVPGNREASLMRMREEMLSRLDLKAAVFIGGMEGVELEYDLFRQFHPKAKTLLVSAPGGAARLLAERLGGSDENRLRDIDFARIFHDELSTLE